MLRGSLGAALGLSLAVLSTPDPAHAQTYSETVTFSVTMSETSYGGSVEAIYLLLDNYGGRNRLQDAVRMTNVGGDRWTTDVELNEGDYIYVFVANLTQFVDLSDDDLNPDDVPDSNFFNDPRPRFDGFGGQFSTDNIYLIRNPNRPTFDATASSPKAGDLITSGSANVSVRVNLGNDRSPIDPNSAGVQVELTSTYGLAPGPTEPPPVEMRDVNGVSFSPDANGGTLNVTASQLPEGVHNLHIDVSNQAGLEADQLVIPIWINQNNEAPIADAGPTQFAHVGRWIQIDGGNSEDPDRVGFSRFDWRVISGPGAVDMRSISQEPDNRNGAQRRGDGSANFDEDGNTLGYELPAMGAVPHMRFWAPGIYKIGLTVVDREGLSSNESEVEVHVSQWVDGAPQLELHVGTDSGSPVVKVHTKNVDPNAPIRFVADSRTPAMLVPGPDGRSVRLVNAPPGVYFIHAQSGDLNQGASYPAEAIVKVEEDLSVRGRDINMAPRFWRQDALLYLLFIREFQDSDGDGEGDLQGAIDKLPHLKKLGVNAIWLMPVEPSGTTHGYSMDAFFAVNEDYGSAEDLRRFITRAHELGIQVVLDYVLNHTSSRHPWFLAAEENLTSVTRDRFLFQPDGSYQYTFNFIGLPDLDYNNPIVRLAAVERARFWMELGLDGFRCDIAGFTPPSVWRQVRRETLAQNPDAFMLAEIIPPVAEFIDGQFDSFYDPWVYWELRDGFAGNKEFSSLDGAMKAAERYVQNQPTARIREAVDPAHLVRVRYLGNQDEDRFLFLAGGSKDRQRVAAAVLLTLPGTPLITYGDEVALIEARGRMSFQRDPEMLAHYQKYTRIRAANPGLRGQSTGNPGEPGNRYQRISSDWDQGGGKVFSFLRQGNGQTFVVLANRDQASVLGTPATYFVAPEALARIPGNEVVLTNHANPQDTLTVSKSDLAAGHTSNVGAYETKVYQAATLAIPDADGDGVLDSFDHCQGIFDQDRDDDGDGVADTCDHCADSPFGEDVGMDGCPRTPGAPKPNYTLDGQLDDAAFDLQTQDDLQMHVSYNGRVLYVAFTGALDADDHVLYVADGDALQSTLPSPWSLPGRTAAPFALLDDGYSEELLLDGFWFGVDSAPANTVSGGFVENTINLVERFGDNIPESIQLAVVRYRDGAVVGQVPVAITANNNIEADEFYTFALVAPEIRAANVTPTPDAGPRPDAGSIDDLDQDTIADADDNCINVPNRDQADLDNDGRGDACDACPTTKAGDRIDSRGCSLDGPDGPGSNFEKPPQSESGCRSTQGDLPTYLLLLVFMIPWIFKRRFTALFAVVLLSGCNFGFGDATEPGPGRRLVTGALMPPDASVFQMRPLSFELVAASLDARAADPIIGFVPGYPFSPSANGPEPVPFRVIVPTDRSYVLFFQSPVDGSGGVGSILAPIRFAANAQGDLTDRLPARSTDLNLAENVDLGIVQLTVASTPGPDCEGCVPTYEVLVGEGESTNPLTLTDADGDGRADFEDADDDQDLIPDDADEDADNDGVLDQFQTLDALADTNADGLPDRLQAR